MSKNTRIILLLSLAVNLLCIGAIAGHFLRVLGPDRYGHPPFRGHPPHEALQNILPEEKAVLFEKAMRQNFKKHRTVRPKIKAAHDKMEQIMVAETFDAEAFRVQLNVLDALHARAFRSMGESLLEILPQLTLEERKRLAGYLKKHRPPPPPGGMPPPGGATPPF